MIVTLSQLEPITVCDFLADTMDPDRVYELVDGEWMLMPAESDRNQRIGLYETAIFQGNTPLNSSLLQDLEKSLTAGAILTLDQSMGTKPCSD